ncbi:MAG TPA: (2Fe-2S)-binding protein [Pseudonocardia sp.]|uniref:(2Fe-2S)-binding protein n=1 Tax=Pseudonocardia sp. TaxID=60912 RepID=UPI002ED9CB00
MCVAVTEAEVRDCIHAGARTVDEVSKRSFACTGCGGCRESIEEMLANGGVLGRASRLCALPQSA